MKLDKLDKILFFSLPIALSSMYVKNFFGGVSKKVSQELTENIRQEMSLDIADLDWMDDKTRYLSWLSETASTNFFVNLLVLVYKIHCIVIVTIIKWGLNIWIRSLHTARSYAVNILQGSMQSIAFNQIVPLLLIFSQPRILMCDINSYVL